jgi:hypothetical protein
LIDSLARHSRAIAIASLPFVIVVVAMASAKSRWYYAVLAVWLLILVALASRLERLEPGALAPKRTSWAATPAGIARSVAVAAYAALGAYVLLWAISKM